MSKKRKTYTAEFKFSLVMEGIRGEKPIAQLCREHDVTESLYYKWRDQFLEQAPHIFADQRHPKEDKQAEKIAELERIIGQLTVENTVLKKAKNLLGLDWT